MISITSTKNIDSTAVPGVSFVVRQLNLIGRAKRDLPVIDTHVRQSVLQREYFAILQIVEDARTPEQLDRMQAIYVEYSLLEESVKKPAIISAGLISLEGLEIDGSPVTAETLLELAGHDQNALLDEIYTACR